MRHLLPILIWISTAALAVEKDNQQAFDATFEDLLKVNYIPEDANPSGDLWNKLNELGSMEDIREALKKALLNPAKENQWRNASRLARDAQVDPYFMANWARQVLKTGKLIEREKDLLLDTILVWIIQWGAYEDADLLRQVADALPEQYAGKKRC